MVELVDPLNKWVDRQIMAVNSEFYSEICLQESGREQLRITPDTMHMSTHISRHMHMYVNIYVPI